MADTILTLMQIIIFFATISFAIWNTLRKGNSILTLVIAILLITPGMIFLSVYLELIIREGFGGKNDTLLSMIAAFLLISVYSFYCLWWVAIWQPKCLKGMPNCIAMGLPSRIIPTILIISLWSVIFAVAILDKSALYMFFSLVPLAAIFAIMVFAGPALFEILYSLLIKYKAKKQSTLIPSSNLTKYTNTVTVKIEPHGPAASTPH